MRFIKALLLVAFVCAGVALALRAGLGPSRFIGSPLNAEGIAFLAFLACCGLGYKAVDAGTFGPYAIRGGFASELWPVLVIGGVAIAAYLPIVDAPFLFDDYTHLAMAGHESWKEMIARSLIEHPKSGDFFFRPAGYVSYWLDYRWAGLNPALWHSWNIFLHAINSVLLYVLSRQLSFRNYGPLVAGLVFAVHGAHPEVVAWMAARFDLLACFFSLVTLIALNHFADERKAVWFVVMTCGCLLATLSKEAAFCLPLLAASLILFKTQRPPKEIAKLAGVLAVLCAVVFCYRVWFLGGIGGYKTAAGVPTVFTYSLLRTVKALLFRQSAVLFFPVNWSIQPGGWLLAASVVFLLAAFFLLLRGRFEARLAGCVALVVAAALPVQHLLLIGADLSGARVLYLPSAGVALLWGLLLQYERSNRAVALAAGLLFFQAAALEHNLQIWKSAAQLSRKTCLQAADELRRDPRPITVGDLPGLWNGVYFLRNGFAQCVAITSHQPANANRVVVNDPAARVFRWDDASQELRPQ